MRRCVPEPHTGRGTRCTLCAAQLVLTSPPAALASGVTRCTSAASVSYSNSLTYSTR